MLKNLWNYRYFVISSIISEIKMRAARSRLAVFWMIFNPLFQSFIYVVIFAGIMSSKLSVTQSQSSYAFYLLTGTVAWSLFSEIVSRCTTIFIEKGDLIKKVSFPKITLPAIVCGSAIINNILLILCVLLFFVFLGQEVGISIFWLPVLIILNILIALGTGLFFGIMNIFVRDVGQFVPIFLQVLFWSTPIVYASEILSHKLSFLLNFNPLAYIVTSYRSIIMYNQSPDFQSLGVLFIVSIVLLFFSLSFYKKASVEMVDAL